MVYVQSSLSLLIDKPIPPLVQFHQKPRNEAFVIEVKAWPLEKYVERVICENHNLNTASDAVKENVGTVYS